MRATALALALASATSGAQPSQRPSDADYVTHHPAAPWWLSLQINSISQYSPGFRAEYSGANSFTPRPQARTAYVATLYAGAAFGETTELLVDVESAGGRGLSEALGLAGYTNLDVVRNPALGPAPYFSRAIVHQVIPLGAETIEVEPGPLRVFSRVAARRIELRVGKMSTVDFFDVNSVGSDSHLQFMNWTADNAGAYDYAADTRGYTMGVEAEYQERDWGILFAELLMPAVANGLRLDFDVASARSENLELEVRRSLLPGRKGAYRALAFLNHARMGNYDEAIARYEEHRDARPDITATRRAGRLKLGFVLNVEQELTSALRVGARASWNDGANESFAYTEVDDSWELCADLRGALWRRPDDKVGLAVVSNGLMEPHRRYLALGGLGFLLGDGALSYGRELVVEGYYNARLWNGVYAAADIQLIQNPGYNRARGPVLAASARLHLDL